MLIVVDEDPLGRQLLIDVAQSRKNVVAHGNVDWLAVARPLPENEKVHIAPERKQHPR